MSRVMSSCARVTVSLVVLLGVTRPAQAQNLVTNPGFTTNDTGWLFGGGGQWDGTRDADGSPTSGSSRLTATNLPANFGTYGRQQCITGITAGAQYQFGGAILVTQGTTGAAGRISILWTSNTACNAYLPTSFSPTVTTQGTWTTTSATVAAPATAVAALVSLDMIGGTTTGDTAVNWDNVFLQEAQPVPALDTAWMTTLALCLLGVASLALMRRDVARRRG